MQILLEKESLDLIICPIGLHHITPDKLDAFYTSLLQTVYAPNGLFILRDHDIRNEEIMANAHTAHTLFNLLIEEASLEDEQAEYRNFQPLQYWIDQLKKHGLSLCKKTPLLQKGDPTLNTLICFKKIPTNNQQQQTYLESKLNNESNYYRDKLQTYLTTIEWFDVDASQDYSNFINHTPFYEYPWLSTGYTYLKLLKNSYQVAAKKDGHLSALTSGYMPMNLFIAISKFIECSAKGVISYPLYKLFSGEESPKIRLLIEDKDEQFSLLSNKIQVVKKLKRVNNLYIVEVPRYKNS